MAAPSPTEGTGRNQAGAMYGLSALCPIRQGSPPRTDRSHESLVRGVLAEMRTDQSSLLAAVDNTYLARLFVLKDVYFEGAPAKEEHLASQYLVFTANLHGDLDSWLFDLYKADPPAVHRIWDHCVAFEQVRNAGDFITYVRRCQITNDLLFQGSTDQPLQEQLKGLYLKQEFGEFVAAHQRTSPAELRQAFLGFVEQVEIDNLARPTWRPGAATLDDVVVR